MISNGALSPLELAFSTSTLSIETSNKESSAKSPSISSSNAIQATAYYRDSSGRARLSLRIRLQCREDGWDAILNSGIVKMSETEDEGIQSIKEDGDDDNDGDDETKDDEDDASNDDGAKTDASLLFECKCRLKDDEDVELDELTVEGVTIVSSHIERSSLSLIFDVETVVRASYLDGFDQSTAAQSVADRTRTVTSATQPSTDDDRSSHHHQQQQQQHYDDDSSENGSKSTTSEDFDQVLTTDLEIRAILELKDNTLFNLPPPNPLSSNATTSPLGLLALELGGGVLPPPLSHTPTSTSQITSHSRYNTHYLHSPPLTIHLILVKALTLSIREIGASRSATGATLLSLTVSHSNLHPLPVTITNITLHPGHSRLSLPPDRHAAAGRSMPGGQLSVIDMSRHVTWGYAPGTTPSFPLVLRPHEAVATVLQVDAGEDLRSRAFYGPVAVTAFVVGGEETDQLVIATDAHWTTARVAVEPVDAFRVDMSLREDEYVIGKPFVVSLKVLNLSNEDRDLMLLMAKDEDTDKKSGKSSREGYAAAHSVNTAVVSEVNGYTFGVWGLAGEDDGTMRHNRDHELLAVDAALLLGEVKGQHSIEAELRFVPLREGTLDVPNLKLYDKMGGKWYNCVHMLKVVAAAR